MGIKSQYNQLARGALITFAFSGISYVIMFVFKIFIARFFGAGDLGMYTLAETILKIGALFAGLGLANGIQRYIPYYKYSENRECLSGYLRFIFRALTASSLILCLFVFGFAEGLTSFFGYPKEFAIVLKIIAFAIPLRVIGNALRHVFIANKQVFFNQVGQNLIEKVVLVVGALVIFLFDLDLIYLVGVLMISILVSFVIEMIFYLYKTKLIKGVEEPEYRYQNWIIFSLPLFFSGITHFLIGWTDNLMIGKLMDPTALGIYSVAFSLAGALTFFKTSISTLFTPLITQNHTQDQHDNIRLLFKRSSSWIFGMTLPVFLIFVFFAEPILRIFYGESFVPGLVPLIIVATGFLISTTMGLNAPILLMYKKTNQIFSVNLGVAIFNLVLNYFMITWIGLLGAAIATAISLVLRNLLFVILARKLHRIGYDLNYMAKFLVSGILAMVAGKLFMFESLSWYIGGLISIGIYILVYGVMLLVLKTFDEHDFQILKMIENKMGFKIPYLREVLNIFY